MDIVDMIFRTLALLSISLLPVSSAVFFIVSLILFLRAVIKSKRTPGSDRTLRVTGSKALLIASAAALSFVLLDFLAIELFDRLRIAGYGVDAALPVFAIPIVILAFCAVSVVLFDRANAQNNRLPGSISAKRLIICKNLRIASIVMNCILVSNMTAFFAFVIFVSANGYL